MIQAVKTIKTPTAILKTGIRLATVKVQTGESPFWRYIRGLKSDFSASADEGLDHSAVVPRIEWTNKKLTSTFCPASKPNQIRVKSNIQLSTDVHPCCDSPQWISKQSSTDCASINT